MSQPTEPTGQPGATDNAATTPTPAWAPPQYSPAPDATVPVAPAADPTAPQPQYTPASPPQYATGQAQYPPAQPQYGAPQYPSGPGYDPNAYATAPQEKGNGLGITAIILAIVIFPIGFILGIVALFKGRTKALGVVAIVLSILVGIGSIAYGAVVGFDTAKKANNAANNTSTSAPVVPSTQASAATEPSDGASAPAAGGADPACGPAVTALTNASTKLQGDLTDPSKAAQDLDDTVNQLTQAQNNATDPAVKSAIGALVTDFSQLRDALKSGQAPSGDVTSKMVNDSAGLATACS